MNMNCKTFENNLPDWVTGRLDKNNASQMEFHAASCVKCSQLADFERSFSNRMRSVPEPTRVPDLWVKLEGRIQSASAPKTFRFAFNKVYAFGGALAAACLLMVAVINMPINSSNNVTVNTAPDISKERQVVQLAADIRTVNETEDMAGNGFPHSGEEAHGLLVGVSGDK